MGIENVNPLLNLLIICISARSAPQILSIKIECTFHFLNFPMTGLCNSSANCLSDILSILLPLLEAFFN